MPYGLLDGKRHGDVGDLFWAWPGNHFGFTQHTKVINGEFCLCVYSIHTLGVMGFTLIGLKSTEMDEKKEVTKEEELAKVDPKLKEAYEKLSEEDKIKLHRGYKTWKTNGKSEYVLVDNFPGFLKRSRGTNLTPKKKKRKKR